MSGKEEHIIERTVWLEPVSLVINKGRLGMFWTHGTQGFIYGPRSFAVSGPSVWNKLPATLRISPTLGQFQASWRQYFFARPTRHDSASSWLLRLLELRLTNFPTYLLTYLLTTNRKPYTGKPMGLQWPWVTFSRSLEGHLILWSWIMWQRHAVC